MFNITFVFYIGFFHPFVLPKNGFCLYLLKNSHFCLYFLNKYFLCCRLLGGFYCMWMGLFCFSGVVYVVARPFLLCVRIVLLVVWPILLCLIIYKGTLFIMFFIWRGFFFTGGLIVLWCFGTLIFLLYVVVCGWGLYLLSVYWGFGLLFVCLLMWFFSFFNFYFVRVFFFSFSFSFGRKFFSHVHFLFRIFLDFSSFFLHFSP